MASQMFAAVTRAQARGAVSFTTHPAGLRRVGRAVPPLAGTAAPRARLAGDMLSLITSFQLKRFAMANWTIGRCHPTSPHGVPAVLVSTLPILPLSRDLPILDWIVKHLCKNKLWLNAQSVAIQNTLLLLGGSICPCKSPKFEGEASICGRLVFCHTLLNKAVEVVLDQVPCRLDVVLGKGNMAAGRLQVLLLRRACKDDTFSHINPDAYDLFTILVGTKDQLQVEADKGLGLNARRACEAQGLRRQAKLSKRLAAYTCFRDEQACLRILNESVEERVTWSDKFYATLEVQIIILFVKGEVEVWPVSEESF
jgi:hypothetical protein